MELEQFKADLEAIGHPEAYDEALTNYKAKEMKTPIEEFIEEECQSSEVINTFFPWFTSNEGFDYWMNIYSKLQAYEKKLMNEISS